MTKATLASLAGMALVGLAASTLEPAAARGALLGAGVGAALGVGAVEVQRRLARSAPKHVFAASTVAFLVQLMALLAGALACRFLPALAANVDWQAFLLGHATLAFGVLVLGSLDVAQAVAAGAVEKGTTP